MSLDASAICAGSYAGSTPSKTALCYGADLVPGVYYRQLVDSQGNIVDDPVNPLCYQASDLRDRKGNVAMIGQNGRIVWTTSTTLWTSA